MLFCNIELKIYVPDGFEGDWVPWRRENVAKTKRDKFVSLFVCLDFMAALSDPRAFMSAQEKREQQIKVMGVEDTDINTKDLKEGDGSGAGGKKGSKSGEKKEEKKGGN